LADKDAHFAILRVLHRVADQVAQRHRQGRLRRIDHQVALAFQRQLQRLATQLGAVRIQQLLGHARDVAGALPALVARQQQQRADQVAALLLGTLDALQALQHLLVQAGPGQQQLGGAADHRQRRAQFVADVGIELAVALHHFGQPRRIIIQRLCQLPHFVVGERGASGSGSLVPPR
jgi:hypothetical protein